VNLLATWGCTVQGFKTEGFHLLADDLEVLRIALLFIQPFQPPVLILQILRWGLELRVEGVRVNLITALNRKTYPIQEPVVILQFLPQEIPREKSEWKP